MILRKMVSDGLIAFADRLKDMISVDHDSIESRANAILSSGCYAGDFEIVVVEQLFKRPIIIYNDADTRIRGVENSGGIFEDPFQPIYIQFCNGNHFNVLKPIKCIC
jgi:hypothetical protein